MELSHHKKDHKTPEEIKAKELVVFKIVKYYHLIYFFLILVMFELKRREYFLISQSIQAVGITVSIFVFLYVIFIVKLNFGAWATDINYVRAWLLVEIIFYFNWIETSIIFLMIAKLLKLKPISQDEQEIELDDNAWNNRQTQDFLCHLKREFFLVNYVLVLTFQTWVIGFRDMYFINLFGPRDFFPTMQLVYVIMAYRIFLLVAQIM